MSVLRANKESLMAVLEAFVYDPLINWRLMQADGDTRRQEGNIKLYNSAVSYGCFPQMSIPTQEGLLNLQRLRHIPKLQPENSVPMKTTFSMVLSPPTVFP